MILRIDHVSIAVGDYTNAKHFFDHLMGAGAGADNEDLRYR